MQIDDIYRYPVKGLTPERLATARLSPGRCILWDRPNPVDRRSEASRYRRIVRCAATRANPLTGALDANPVRELSTNFGHTDCGVYAEVIEGGIIRPGDTVKLGDAIRIEAKVEI